MMKSIASTGSKKIIIFETPKIRGYLQEIGDYKQVSSLIFFEDSSHSLHVLFSSCDTVHFNTDNPVKFDDALRIIGGMELSGTTMDENKYLRDLQLFEEKYGITIKVSK